MKVFYSSQEGHNPKYELFKGCLTQHPETNQRSTTILTELKAYNCFSFMECNYKESDFTSVHNEEYIAFIKTKSSHKLLEDYLPKPILMSSNIGTNEIYIHDSYTPITSSTFLMAQDSANIAIQAANAVLKEKSSAYALCRPPGHHAGPNYAMGYCYLNNAAIAAEKLLTQGRVAILDIDYHHGNGTQEIFYERNDVLFVSVHAHPACKFPYISGYELEIGKGLGEGFNHNYPLMLNVKSNIYLNTLEIALKKINQFNPKTLIVSLGVDTHRLDPVGGLGLEIVDFKSIGNMIKKLYIPTLYIQEGGYNLLTLGKLVSSLLLGYEEVAL